MVAAVLCFAREHSNSNRFCWFSYVKKQTSSCAHPNFSILEKVIIIIDQKYDWKFLDEVLFWLSQLAPNLKRRADDFSVVTLKEVKQWKVRKVTLKIRSFLNNRVADDNCDG